MHPGRAMIIIFGLILLVVAVVVAVAGVLANGGHAHAVTHFAVFGYHVTGSTGTLFLYGIVVGAVGLAGLSMLLAGARRTARRGRDARHGLTKHRDDLIDERETARGYTASTLAEGAPADHPAGDRPPPGGKPNLEQS
jgi:membrane protein implicated in regulation of membrane protease activity